jgi:L-alanine-DL-glutamate epimerase-like enolase superfamily enzyme
LGTLRRLVLRSIQIAIHYFTNIIQNELHKAKNLRGAITMRVTNLTLTFVNWTPQDIRKRHQLQPEYGKHQIAVVTISTDEGIEGHSFLGKIGQWPDFMAPALMSDLKPVLMGQNPLDIGRLWEGMWRRRHNVDPKALAALDVALWDLAGKIMKQPVHRLLGNCREKVPAYAVSSHLSSVQEYAEEAQKIKSLGWTAYKIHGYEKDDKIEDRRDIEICKAVRKAVGDEFTLMLDSKAYSYGAAVRVGHIIEDLGFFWYEDPLADDDVYGYAKLRHKLEIPILATESAPGGLYGLPQFILQEATDMLRGDVPSKGGITGTMKTAHLAEAFRMNCEIHHGGNSLMNAAVLNVIMAINNCDYFEVKLPEVTHKYGLVRDIEVDKDGFIHAPKAPGLGFEIDWELIKSNTTHILK